MKELLQQLQANITGLEATYQDVREDLEHYYPHMHKAMLDNWAQRITLFSYNMQWEQSHKLTLMPGRINLTAYPILDWQQDNSRIPK